MDMATKDGPREGATTSSGAALGEGAEEVDDALAPNEELKLRGMRRLTQARTAALRDTPPRMSTRTHHLVIVMSSSGRLTIRKICG